VRGAKKKRNKINGRSKRPEKKRDERCDSGGSRTGFRLFLPIKARHQKGVAMITKSKGRGKALRPRKKANVQKKKMWKSEETRKNICPLGGGSAKKELSAREGGTKLKKISGKKKNSRNS